MDGQMAHLLRLIGFAAIALVLSATMGCTGGFSGPNQDVGSAQAPTKTAAIAPATSGNDDPGINLQCAVDRIQKTPVPFHWSYKKVVPPLTNADWEADVTPNSIAGTLIDSSGTRVIHGARSDSTSWNTAVLALTGPLPASTFALVNHSSAIVRAGTENVNGEDTIKYAIDTSRDTPADASLIRSVLGANGSVKGAAWVTRTGCPVKFVLDVEQHNKDGTVQKEHYEANVTQP